MNKQYFYIGKEEALKHQSMVYAVSQEPIEFYKEILGDNAVEFYTENLPHYITVDGETPRESTHIELYKAGIYELNDGEFIHDETILSIHDFEIPEGTLKPVFDYNQLKWIETATPEEIEENIWREEVRFYNAELEFASKAVAELKCDIISQEDFEDVKLYMQSIDPYAQNYKRSVKNKRPGIFDRYN
ncbi:MAG: hypothetical protein ACRCX2_20295 [Paraclostridium sp.]